MKSAGWYMMGSKGNMGNLNNLNVGTGQGQKYNSELAGGIFKTLGTWMEMKIISLEATQELHDK